MVVVIYRRAQTTLVRKTWSSFPSRQINMHGILKWTCSPHSISSVDNQILIKVYYKIAGWVVCSSLSSIIRRSNWRDSHIKRLGKLLVLFRAINQGIWPHLEYCLHMSHVAHQARAYVGFCSMKWLGVFLLPPGWDASPSRGTPSITFASIHLYTWLESGTVRIKCLAQEVCPRPGPVNPETNALTTRPLHLPHF